MQYIFDKTARGVLETFCFAETLFAFDFDGTLAPIVSHHSAASMRDSTRHQLTALASQVTVAVISGRQRSDLQLLIPPQIAFALGNHGMEGLPSSDASLASIAFTSAGWKRQLQEKLPRDAGIIIEDKVYSLSLHYRHASDQQAAVATVLRVCEQLDPPPRMVLGKCVVNLVVLHSAHKGQALLELMDATGSPHAIYVGDDDNDEDVFRLDASHILGIRVGYHPASSARFYLRDQSEIDRFLSVCQECVATHRHRNSLRV